LLSPSTGRACSAPSASGRVLATLYDERHEPAGGPPGADDAEARGLLVAVAPAASALAEHFDCRVEDVFAPE